MRRSNRARLSPFGSQRDVRLAKTGNISGYRVPGFGREGLEP